jgi:soluble lytic murein transglycosylase-like protein
MRESSESEEGLFGQNFGGDLFQDMFDGEVARKIAHDQSIGLARLIYESLEKYLPPDGMNASEGLIAPSGFPAGAGGLTVPETDDPVLERVGQYHPIVIDAAKRYDVDPSLVYAIISRESGGNPQVVSSRGAKGLMQLMDGTASDMGVHDAFDPRENIDGGTKYFRMMLDRFDGDVRLALAAYNAGPGAVDEYGGIPPYQETVEYVERVLDTYERVKPLFNV